MANKVMERKQWTRVLIAVIAAAFVALGVLMIRNALAPADPYPGTDVRIATGDPFDLGELGYCHPYSSNLPNLVEISDSIVLGKVASDRPFFEGTYNSDAPRQEDGSMANRRGDFLNRLVHIEVEQTLAGAPLVTADVIVEGWMFDSRGDEWEPIALGGNHRLATGDRAIFAINKSAPADPVSTPDSFSLTCTGAFVIQDGAVQPKPGATEFQEDGVWDMSEAELIAAIRNVAK